MFTLDQLEGFVAVAEEASFGRAAERLMITQPPLSRQIQKLERAVGVTLLLRNSHGTSLTAAGRAFLVEARRVLKYAGNASILAQRVASGYEGAISIGFTGTAAYKVLGNLAKFAKEEMPKVELVLTEMPTRTQVEAILAGELDLGLIRGKPRPDALSFGLIHAESMVLAVHKDHLFVGLDRPVTLHEIAEHELVAYAPIEANYFHELVVSIFRNIGVTPRYAQFAGQVGSLIALVDAGLGIALVPASAAVLQLPNVRFLSIEGLEPRCVEVICAWRESNENAALRAFVSLIESRGLMLGQ